MNSLFGRSVKLKRLNYATLSDKAQICRNSFGGRRSEIKLLRAYEREIRRFIRNINILSHISILFCLAENMESEDLNFSENFAKESGSIVKKYKGTFPLLEEHKISCIEDIIEWISKTIRPAAVK